MPIADGCATGPTRSGWQRVGCPSGWWGWPEPNGVVEPLATIASIELDRVTYRYPRGAEAVKDLSWVQSEPAVVGLLGPNGAGKTSLLRLLATVMRPSSGRLRFDGLGLDTIRQVRSARGKIGYLPQDFGFYGAFTALEAVSYVGWLKGMTSRIAHERATRALDQVGLTSERGVRLRSLSGGQQRRVGIAQALVNDPDLLLLDEPTAGLDPSARIDIRSVLRHVGRDAIVIVSTHLVEDVVAACDHVLVMSAATLLFTGTPQELESRGREGHRAAAEQGISSIELGYRSLVHSTRP